MDTTEVESTGRLSAELLDVHCRAVITPVLVPWLYTGLVGGAGVALLWLTVWAFERAAWLGWLHAVLIAPLGLLTSAALSRAMIEVALAVLEIRAHVGEIGELPRRVSSWPAMRRIVALGESRVWTARR